MSVNRGPDVTYNFSVTDDELDALRRRDPEAIARAVRAHAGDLLRAARGLGLGEADAEELVQASFAAFLEAAPRFEGRSTVRTYLFGILYRKALERGRLKGRELATDPSDAVFDGRFDRNGHWSPGPRGPDAEADVAEIARLIAACLESLSPKERAAFMMKEVDRESPEDVRNALGVQDTHLRVLLFRARNKLRTCIEGRWKVGS
jgi:RNA polymerase sigma-70 factor (ECF subfamily)